MPDEYGFVKQIERNIVMGNRLCIREDKFVAVLFVLSFLLNDYNSGIPGIKLSEVLLLLLVVYSILKKKASGDYISKQLIRFYIICFALSLIATITIQLTFSIEPFIGVVSRWIRYGLHVYFLFAIQGCLDPKTIIKSYMKIAVIVSLYMIFQFVSYYALHLVLPIKVLPFFSWEREFDSLVLGSQFAAGYFRSYGLMAEPSYSAMFLLPALSIALHGANKKEKLIEIVILIVALMTTLSLQGILICGITLILFTFDQILGEKNGRRGVIHQYLFIIIIALCFISIVFINSKYSTPIIHRFNSISQIRKAGGTGSTALRLYRGFSIFDRLPFIAKIIGVGLGNIGNAVDTFRIITIYDSSAMTKAAIEYVNGIASILISSGILGGLAAVDVFHRIYKRLCDASRIILFQFIILLFSGMGIFQIEIVLYFSLMILLTKYTEKELVF